MADAQNKAPPSCAVCGGEQAEFKCPCETAFYCGKECQRIDWERGHREVCKKIRAERAAEEEAKRSVAPTREPLVFYGPAERTCVDDARDRVKAEHEAARAWREANPEPEPRSTRFGNRCPICMDDWPPDSSLLWDLRDCCCQAICKTCAGKIGADAPCPFCLAPPLKSHAEIVAALQRHVENGCSEAMVALGNLHVMGSNGLYKSTDTGVRLWEQAVDLGNVDAMFMLGFVYAAGSMYSTKQDPVKAMNYFKMASDRGCALSQHRLANILFERKGVKSALDHSRAIIYLKLAASQGLAIAQYHLAQHYMMKFGTSGEVGDLEESKRLFSRAAENGYDEAKPGQDLDSQKLLVGKNHEKMSGQMRAMRVSANATMKAKAKPGPHANPKKQKAQKKAALREA